MPKVIDVKHDSKLTEGSKLFSECMNKDGVRNLLIVGETMLILSELY